MRFLLKYYTTATILLYSSLSFSGGPLVLEGASGNTPVRYQDPNITIHVESGDLGTLSNTDANTLVQEAFNLWNQVDTASVNLTINSTEIDEDVNLSNFENYLPSLDNAELNAEDNLNPLIYDDNGEIIDAYFGVGQNDFTVGFAASILTRGSSFFDEGYAVINGKDLNLNTTTLKLLVTHEIGHFIGLDHSQANIDNQETDFGLPRICATSNSQDYPLMYPFICRDSDSLYADDISAVSALYPTAALNSNFGIVQGVFVDENIAAILGANVWAENVSTGESYSIVSDYLMQQTGFYKIYLPAGNYTLHANSINELFNSSSGVGPYSQSILDLSFSDPHPISQIAYQSLNTGEEEVLTVSAGQTLTINFSSAGIFVDLPDSNEEKSDDIADLFGSTSHITLVLMFSCLMLLRIYHRHLD